MAQTSWPFENIDTSETQFSQWARNIGEGIITGKGLELEVSADGSGMVVFVDSGQCLIRGHYYNSTDTETLTISAADLTNPRIDSVVLRLDPTANSVVLAVLAGTPNASPSAPALTQTDGGVYEIRIANVLVDAAAVVIASNKITDVRELFTPWSGLVTISQVTGLQTALDEKQDVASAVSTKTANYTLAVGDTNDLVQVNGEYTITVPANTFETGTRVDVANIGTGVVTFAAGAGFTLNSKDSKLTIATQYSAATVFFTSATTGLLVGDLA